MLVGKLSLCLQICILTMLIAGCSDNTKPSAAKSGSQVKEGVAFAKSMLEKVNRDPMADASFCSMCEMGGTPLSYLSACMGEKSPKVKFCEGKPDTPNSVSVTFDNDQQSFVIEGYTDDLTKPAIVERIKYTGTQARRAGTASAPQTKEEQIVALCDACSTGDAVAVKKLIAQGVDVNSRSSEGATPLMYACAKSQPEIVKLLLAAKADPVANANDQNAWPVLMYAAHSGSTGAITALLEKGALPDDSDRYQDTPLMLAAMRGHKEAVEVLAKAGAKLNVQETRNNNSPLLHATSAGHDGAAIALIKAGADVNISDKVGMTPLMSCAERGRTNIAASLIAAKANTEAKITGPVGTGATALMLAAAKGQEPMVRLLLAAGANPKATDKGGSTAQRYATHNSQTAIAELLKTAEATAKPPAATGPATATPQAAAAPTPAVDLQSLIGKDQQAADALLGAPTARLRRGETTICIYKGGEITIEKGIITGVKR